MSAAITLEIVRQLLRWLSVYLLGFGMPAEVAALFEHPEIVNGIAAAISLGLAEGGWLIVKVKQFREWLDQRSWWGS